MEIWISIADAIDVLGISKAAFHKARHKYTCRAVKGSTGMTFEVRLDKLPIDAQTKFWSKQGSDDKNISDEAAIYASAPEHARKKADKYINLIKQSTGLTGTELKAFVADWNQKNPDSTTSYARLIDARKKYQQCGITSLLGKWGKRSGESSVTDECFAFFKSLYLKEGRPSAVSCWKMTLAWAHEHNYNTENFPAHTAFMRRIEREIPQQALCTARDGAAAANKKYGYYIKRSYDDVAAGECWVSDHAQVDVAVSYINRNGQPKYGFPWVTVWRDFKSGKWLGWDIHMEDPCSDHIFMSWHRAASEYGISSYVYLDNGKDYRCKDFAGGRTRFHKVSVDENKTTSLMAALDINVIYAWPYNAQSKTVERDFNRNKEWFSKHDSGYRGGNIVERPESLNDVIKSGNIMSFDEFEKLFTFFIINVINKSVVSSGYREGVSPDQMWDNEIQESINSRKVKAVSKDALMLFCTRTTGIISVGRRGIHDSELGVDYYSEWLEGLKGKKVYIRRDPQNMQDAWVFDPSTHAYLGMAYINNETSALAEKTEVSRAELKRQIAVKRSSNKLHKTIATTDIENITTQQRIMLLAKANQIADMGKDTKPAKSMCFPSIETTQMDIALQQKKQLNKQFTDDLSILGLHRQKAEKKKRDLIVFPSDREQVAL